MEVFYDGVHLLVCAVFIFLYLQPLLSVLGLGFGIWGCFTVLRFHGIKGGVHSKDASDQKGRLLHGINGKGDRIHGMMFVYQDFKVLLQS